MEIEREPPLRWTVAGQLAEMHRPSPEPRSPAREHREFFYYNERGQMTRQQSVEHWDTGSATKVDFQYVYPSAANAGRIEKLIDNVDYQEVEFGMTPALQQLSANMHNNSAGASPFAAIAAQIEQAAQQAARWTREKLAKEAAMELSCNQDIRDAMKAAWAQSANGTTGVEAGFRLDGSPENYTIVENDFTNQQGQQTLSIIRGTTFAVFHTRPNASGAKPSTPSTSANQKGDTHYADLYNFDVFVMSSRGLWYYDHETRKSFELYSTIGGWTEACE